MKKELRWTIGALFIISLFGCEKEISTQIVKEKEVGYDVEWGNTRGKSNKDAEHITFAEMVKAPESYSVALARKDVTVTGRSEVIVPDVEMISVKSVKGRGFTEQEKEQFANAVFRGVPSLEEEVKGGVDEGMEAFLSNKYSCSIEEVVSDFTILKREAEVDGEPSSFYHWTQSKPNEGLGESMLYVPDIYMPELYWYHYVDDENIRKELQESLKTEEAIQKGNELVAQLGYNEMQLTGCEYIQNYSSTEKDYAGIVDLEPDKLTTYGIVLNYSRVVDGVTITYWNGQENEAMNSGERYYWPAENLSIIYSDTNELVKIQYSDPYEVVEGSKEETFLLPFEDIKKVFEKIILSKYEMSFRELTTININLTQVRLGYMRVKKAGGVNALEGQLIPVWDFMGRCEYTYFYEGDDKQVGEADIYLDPVSTPLLTINAMDGSIIDRWE